MKKNDLRLFFFFIIFFRNTKWNTMASDAHGVYYLI